MIITFGKFNGWDTDDLAKAGQVGRNYLSWGADKLKSPKWRKEFERALRENEGTDLHLAARALSRSEPDIDMYEAERIIRDEIAEQEKWLAQVERRDEARAAVIKKYTAIIGLDEATLRKAIASVEQYVFAYDEFPPQARFSSPERRRQMQAMYDEWMACYEVMEV